MLRILAVAWLAFHFGDPAFDGMRPSAIDRPLKEINQGVKRDLSQTAYALNSVFAMREMPGGKAYVAGMKDLLKHR